MAIKTVAYVRNSSGKPTALLDVASLEPSVYEGLKKQAEAQSKEDEAVRKAEEDNAEAIEKEASEKALKKEYFSVWRLCFACDSISMDYANGLEVSSEEAQKAIETKRKALSGESVADLLMSDEKAKERFVSLFGEEPK
jgi:hypothetical protein